MNRLETLKEKLKKQENILCTTIANIVWSGLAQKASQYPFDFMIFDLEHGTLNIEMIEETLRICRLADLPTVVRIPDSIPNLISKPFDMGADGILLPRVESIMQVETAIRFARYFPKGRKGCGGFSNLRADDEMSVDKYNSNRMIFIQMESMEGLAVLPEILSKYKDELAGIIIGPYDASIMLGTPFNITSNIMIDYIKKVFSICKAENISHGIFIDTASMMQNYHDLGANIFWTGTDVSLLCEGYAGICESFNNLKNKS
jgi:2-keto-3-deoxy-L-rhamnonate aldolase RhmA